MLTYGKCNMYCLYQKYILSLKVTFNQKTQLYTCTIKTYNETTKLSTDKLTASTIIIVEKHLE